MALMALASTDAEVRERVRDGVDRRWHDLLHTPSWEALPRTVRERPVSVLLVDLDLLPPEGPPALVGLRRDYPSLPVVVLARRTDPYLLFDLGRSGASQLVLLDAEGPRPELRRAFDRALTRSAAGMVVRQLTELVEPDVLTVLRGALELTHRCWCADRFARSFGLSRPVLSERLRASNLPATGHLMLWARLLHAGHWLPDPGRSGESVSRQLEYANGAVFRRALRSAVGVTPTRLAGAGGLGRVLEAFASEHALPLGVARLSVA
jgi:AraC-like DNA-binding protein